MKKKDTLWVTFVCFLIFLLPSNLYADQVYSLKAPNYRMDLTDDGFTRVLLEGYYSYGVPGYPDLPCKIFRFVVPADVVRESIKVEYSIKTIEDLGQFDIRELPPMATRHDDRMVLGGKVNIYSNSEYYPEEAIEYLGFSQMRKWKFINVKYTPFQYNPGTKDLRFIPEVEIKIIYDRAARSSVPETELEDKAMEERAKELFENYQQGKEWYKPLKTTPAPSATYDYVIITTNAIESSSAKLSDFVTYLSGKGYSPLVITEDEYGGLTGQSPNGTAEKIRQWLINNYSSYGIVYVLLIGDPDPDDPSSASDSVGDVPMKMCWPRSDSSSYRESPTDYFYADLTGNWDLNGNGYFGEYNGDRGTGGVDFANEVYVGRIPVYSGVADLDSVLTKTISYGGATSITWRKNALLPMSFSDASTDGAYLSEAMITNYLTPNSYSNYTLYMQGSVCAAANSSFSSNEELVSGATETRWSNNTYGMVWWWGHGSATSASLGYDDCGWGTIMASSDASSLDDNYPSHVYQCSCLNGYPENSSNLGTALLYNGAITTNSASRVSWYAVTSWSTSLKYYCDNASIGYYYGKEIVDNSKRASVALFDVKSDMGANMNGNWGGSSWMNLFDFNLYGDPAVGITTASTDTTIYVESSGTCNGNTPCYSTIQGAVDAASTGTTIKIAGGSYGEDVSLSTSKNLTFKGGYDSTFTTQSSETTLNTMTISNGVVVVDKLTLTSAAPLPNISYSGSDPYDYGTVQVGSSSDHNFTIQNTGTATLNISGASVSGTGFSVVGSVPSSISAGGSDTITVRFAPSSVGSHTGTLSINSDDPDTPTLNIGLNGTGDSAPQQVANIVFYNNLLCGGSSFTATLTIDGKALTSVTGVYSDCEEFDCGVSLNWSLYANTGGCGILTASGSRVYDCDCLYEYILTLSGGSAALGYTKSCPGDCSDVSSVSVGSMKLLDSVVLTKGADLLGLTVLGPLISE